MKKFKSIIPAALAVIVFCIFAVSNCAYAKGPEIRITTENRSNEQGPIKTHKYDWRKGSTGFQSGIQGTAVSVDRAGNLGNDYVEINSSYQGVEWAESLRKDSTAIKIKSEIKSGK